MTSKRRPPTEGGSLDSRGRVTLFVGLGAGAFAALVIVSAAVLVYALWPREDKTPQGKEPPREVSEAPGGPTVTFTGYVLAVQKEGNFNLVLLTKKNPNEGAGRRYSPEQFRRKLQEEVSEPVIECWFPESDPLPSQVAVGQKVQVTGESGAPHNGMDTIRKAKGMLRVCAKSELRVVQLDEYPAL